MEMFRLHFNGFNDLTVAFFALGILEYSCSLAQQ